MKSLSFGNFQVGMVDDPSVEDQGGFEFAGGMDIFSEPGVMKASLAMEAVSFGVGAAPTDVPRFMVDAVDGSTLRGYITAGSKLLESTDGTNWNLFRTNSNGNNLGLGVWNGYVLYLSSGKIGRALLGNSGSANDSFLTTLDAADEYPIVAQGGTLKIGASRYIASLDEAFALTARAMKVPAAGYKIRALAEHFTNLFMGSHAGLSTIAESSAFAWRGVVLASGTALPDTPFPMKQRGLNALISDGRNLYGFDDRNGDVLLYQGAGFEPYRQLIAVKTLGTLVVNPGAVTEHQRSILFAGDTSAYPGVFQMKDGAICHAYVPSVFVPGAGNSANIGFVKSSFNGTVLIGYYESSGGGTYRIERTSTTGAKQNNAAVRTLWHRVGTNKLKRWAGVKLNLKNLGANTSVKVEYRTVRGAAFTDPSISITPSNQDKPALFPVNPRSREIQFQFTYTTSTSNTPELLSYDPIFEVINSNR